MQTTAASESYKIYTMGSLLQLGPLDSTFFQNPSASASSTPYLPPSTGYASGISQRTLYFSNVLRTRPPTTHDFNICFAQTCHLLLCRYLLHTRYTLEALAPCRQSPPALCMLQPRTCSQISNILAPGVPPACCLFTRHHSVSMCQGLSLSSLGTGMPPSQGSHAIAPERVSVFTSREQAEEGASARKEHSRRARTSCRPQPRARKCDVQRVALHPCALCLQQI